MQSKFKAIQTIALFIIITTVSTAQEKEKFSIGLHGGPAGSTWLGNKSLKKNYGIKYHLNFGFVAGASIQYNFKPRLGLYFEVNYERKGSAINIASLGRYTYDNDYLTIPIILKFQNNKKNRFFAGIGPYTGYLIKSSSYINKLSDKTERIEGNVNTLNRFDCGITLSLGWNIPIKTNFLFSIEFRNSTGILPLTKGATYANEHPFNESIAMLMGFAYKIK